MLEEIQELFECAKQCYAEACVTLDKDAKQLLQQAGDQFLKEAHDLADKNPGWTPKARRPRTIPSQTS